jgi:hypothetical protein
MTPVERWLLALADPEKPADVLPPDRLDVTDAPVLCVLAELHGVLPAVLQHVEDMLRSRPGCLLADEALGPDALKAIDPMRRRLAERSAMVLFLAAEAHRLNDELAAAGAEVIVLKGLDFAARLYPQRWMRTFGDMDLLVRRDDWGRVETVMARSGYVQKKGPMKHAGGYAERCWEHPAMPGANVEVHDNLVNSPTVRRGVSVRLEDLPLERAPDGRRRATPAGLLIIAAVHGAASHGFEKMQHLCDIVQVARGRAGAIDEASLRGCLAKTGAGFSVAVALDLVARTFQEPAAAQLLDRLELRWPRRMVRLLMTPAVVVRSQGALRRSLTWRRRVLRQMLKSRR